QDQADDNTAGSMQQSERLHAVFLKTCWTRVKTSRYNPAKFKSTSGHALSRRSVRRTTNAHSLATHFKCVAKLSFGDKGKCAAQRKRVAQRTGHPSVLNVRSPASPRPGTMNLRSF